MDLSDWAAGTWYSEMAHVARDFYDTFGVNGEHCAVIERLILGMEARAANLLDIDDKTAAGALPPPHLVTEHLRSGKPLHKPKLRPPIVQPPSV